MSALNIFLLVVLVLCTLWTILVPSLLQSAIGLAAISIVLSIIMFQLHAPLASVFELSVCAGLITVVFISTISLTRRRSAEDEVAADSQHMKKFVWALVVVIILAPVLWFLYGQSTIPSTVQPMDISDTREILWNLRRFDLLGQLLIILAGVFGIVILFKRRNLGETKKK